ncbi:hypothetical protein CPB85DRAFT_257719 [Mucidula mucida]|nr:hypothetical protein CPB85DRAFT_257719 [Mucidula mucida]
MSTSSIHGVDAMDAGRRQRARSKLDKINLTLRLEKMRAVSPLDELPYYYYPDYALNHYPPQWFLGIIVTRDDFSTFAQKHNLVTTSNDPSDKDPPSPVAVVRKYLADTCKINAACSARLQLVHADTSNTQSICISLCSNYTVLLCRDNVLKKTEARLLELWDFIGPKIAWYLNALRDPNDPTEWPLDRKCSAHWMQFRLTKTL